MFKQFDSVDPECDHHWDEKVYFIFFIVQISELKKNIFHEIAFSNLSTSISNLPCPTFQIRKAWKIFDKNGDGKITKQEFRLQL